MKYTSCILYLMIFYLIQNCIKSQPNSNEEQDYIEGKVIIITGANSGIGFETTKELARRGGRIFMACRNLTRAEKAKNDILQEIPRANLTIRHIDLASLQAVRDFCANFTAEEKRLDILINNAGITENKKILTGDGFEIVFQTNHLGHFLLTNILLSRMRVFGGRIVIVSSTFHNLVLNVDFENLNSENYFDAVQAYSRSKLFNILFMRELNRRFAVTNDLYKRITVNALHPGMVNTSIFKMENGNVYSLNRILYTGIIFTFKNPKDGAESSIYLSGSKDVEGISGHYYEEKVSVPTSILGADKTLAQKVWQICQNFVHLRNDEYNIY